MISTSVRASIFLLVALSCFATVTYLASLSHALAPMSYLQASLRRRPYNDIHMVSSALLLVFPTLTIVSYRAEKIILIMILASNYFTLYSLYMVFEVLF